MVIVLERNGTRVHGRFNFGVGDGTIDGILIGRLVLGWYRWEGAVAREPGRQGILRYVGIRGVAQRRRFVEVYVSFEIAGQKLARGGRPSQVRSRSSRFHRA